MRGAGLRLLAALVALIFGIAPPAPLDAQARVGDTSDQIQINAETAERSRSPLVLRLSSHDVLPGHVDRVWTRPLAMAAAWQGPPQGSGGGSRTRFKVGLVILGAVVAGTGAYLVSTAKPKWQYASLGGDYQCLDYNPYAGTGAPEVHCKSAAKVGGYMLVVAGAGLSVIGLLGR
jgi:hypothetical protein